MATTAVYDLKLNITETAATGLDLITNPTMASNITGSSGTLGAATTPVVTKSWWDTIALSAGSSVINLQSLGFGNLTAIDFTGLRIELMKIKAAAANTELIVITGDSSTGVVGGGYHWANDSSHSVSVAPGQIVMLYGNDANPVVSNYTRTLNITSDDVDASVDIQIAAG